MHTNLPTKPTDIRFDVEHDLIHFIWENEKTVTLSHDQLRQACPCAFCRYNKIKKLPISSMQHVQVIQLNSQGYGIQICFNDGHDKGIFPWEYLKNMS
ncbi:DUF971 domain-containing protein [Acinetobacter sp. CFCC 10889]|uniref:DUF971 domain-containing protein n=1 Tax=Acinetobacter sp. CFCC 10889 TaxID=1775557 RepID=UPI000DD0661D|nr:DUF971 domain-containing protein [Acinetobacter sp. CFCC 10889]